LCRAFHPVGPGKRPILTTLYARKTGYGTATGAARLLLAAMAAIADDDGGVRDFTIEQIRAAAGLAATISGRRTTCSPPES
jgi:hypothetical protein